jgi:hypothetical protein
MKYQIARSMIRFRLLNSEQFSPGGQGPQARMTGKGKPKGNVSEMMKGTTMPHTMLNITKRIRARKIFRNVGFNMFFTATILA